MNNKFVLRPIIACLPGIFLALSAPIHAGETIAYPGDSLQTVNGTGNSLAPSGSAGAAGASKSASLSDNHVTVNDTGAGAVGGNVYGAINSLDADAVANNQVLINNGGSVKAGVYGGFSVFGTVTNNSVTLSGGSVSEDVYGGWSVSGDAINNSVTLNDGSVGGDVYGGWSSSGDATGNSVTLNGGSVSGVYGGYSDSGDATNNSVTLNDGSVAGNVSGGSSNSGDATNNSVTLNDGSVIGNVYSGFSYSGAVTNNSVTLNDGLVNGSVYGGFSNDSGATTDNSVTISGGSVDRDVYGGYSNSGDAAGNSVTVSDGSVDWNVYGGFSYSGAVTNNIVTLNDGSVGGSVSGGRSIGGTAINNSVTLNDGSVGGDVYGGFSDSGDATNNSVTLNDGSVIGNVYGGSSNSGAVTNNSVTLNDGLVNGSVYGGFSNDSGATTDNSVTISGGSVDWDVYGGYSNSGDAAGNSVTYSGGAITGSLYGGATSGSGDAFSGNTLDVKGAGLSVGGDLKNFQFLNFYLPSTMVAGTTALTVGGVADLTNGAGASSTVNLGIEGGSSPLKAGDTITLIDAGTLTTESGLNTTANGQGMQGISLKYDFNILTDNNKLLATLTSVGVNPQTKALSEGRIAGLAFASQGGDLVAGPGMAALVADTDKLEGSLTAFGVMSGGSSRYNTGSHVDVDGVSLMTGLGWRAPLAQNALRVGAFVEAGWGNYDSHNAFSNAASVNGSGDTHYYGLGMLARYELTDSALKGLYADASLRAGRTATDFSSDDLHDALGRIARYDSHSSYYGAHAGIGYVWHLNDQSSLDFSSKYLWTRQGSDAVTVAGDPVRFDAADSSRWRNGVRFSHTLADKSLSLYAGAYYEHEFDGKVNATTYGYAIDAPQLKGDTGIGELGLRYRPQAADGNTGGFSLDAGIQGYVGDRRGMSGSARMMYAF